MGQNAVWWWWTENYIQQNKETRQKQDLEGQKGHALAELQVPGFHYIFYYNNFCMIVAGPLIFKAEVKATFWQETLLPPSPTMPHKNISSQIKTELLESSKITSLATVCLVSKIAFNLF